MHLFARTSSCHKQHCAVVSRVFECSSLRAYPNRYWAPYSSRSTSVWTRRATLHAEFADAQGGGTEERRREDEKPLPWAHAYCRGLDGQLRAMSRTQQLHINNGISVSPNVNVRHRTKRGKSQRISGRHRRLKKNFFLVSWDGKNYFLFKLGKYL